MTASRKPRSLGITLLVLVVAGLAYLAERQGWINLGSGSESNPPTESTGSGSEPSPSAIPEVGRRKPAPEVREPETPPAAADDAAARIAAAFEARRSDLPVEVAGTVVKVLPDDREGSRHQKLILRISDDMTLLVAHNIDLAPRVPVAEGDELVVAGDYEWNERGGLIHWTHHDPAGRHRDGWIRHRGKVYK